MSPCRPRRFWGRTLPARAGGAVIAALALLMFSINWAGFLIIALLALYEYGLHRPSRGVNRL